MSEDPGIYGVGGEVSEKSIQQIQRFLTTYVLGVNNVVSSEDDLDLTYIPRTGPDTGSVIGKSSHGLSVHFGQVVEFPFGKRVDVVRRNDGEIVIRRTIKLTDKGRNLERLGRHLKLFVDRTEHGVDASLVQRLEAADARQKRRQELV